MIANTPDSKHLEIGYKIASFYLEKHNGDYAAAEKEVKSLCITDIKLIEDKHISIYLSRPGLLIGRHGINIENLSVFLDMKITIVEAFNWVDVLVPFDQEIY